MRGATNRNSGTGVPPGDAPKAAVCCPSEQAWNAVEVTAEDVSRLMEDLFTKLLPIRDQSVSVDKADAQKAGELVRASTAPLTERLWRLQSRLKSFENGLLMLCREVDL